jgi:hypothetical protein
MFLLFLNVCCNLHWLYTVCYKCKCFSRFKRVASVLSGCCICCNGYTHMLQVYVSNVSAIFKRMLQVFYLDMMLHMLHWLYTYVTSVRFKYLSCFKHKLQVFYLDVAYIAVAIHICCKCMFVNVSSVLDVCCSKCFYVEVLHDQAWEVGADGGGPLGHSGPRMRGCPHIHAQAHAYRSSSSAWTSAAATCWRAGRSYMDVLWPPPRQSGRWRRGARVSSVDRMHLGSASPAPFPAACRVSASDTWTSSRCGRPNVPGASFVSFVLVPIWE